MTILLLTDSDVFAGTEQHLHTLAVALQKQGQTVYVGCPDESVLRQRCNQSSVATVSIQKNGAIDIRAIAKCLALIKTLDISVLHVHNARTALIGSFVKLFKPSLGLVFTQHFISPSHMKRTGILRLISNVVHDFIASKLDKVICVSQLTEVALKKSSGPYRTVKSQVIYNGIDIEAVMACVQADTTNLFNEFGLNLESKVVLIASRIEPEKAVEVGIRAFASLVAHDETLALIIAGDGSQRKSLERLVFDLEIERRVRFVGFRSDLPLLMSHADTFLFTSPIDSFGMTIIESMFIGTPVVAPDAGGPSEIITDGLTGYLYNPNSVENLANKLLTCLYGNEQESIVNAAKIHATLQFSASKMATETTKIYESVQYKAPR